MGFERGPVAIRARLEGRLADAKAFADGEKVGRVGNISANLGSVEGDAPRLSRLVAGLLDNAVRFTAPSRKSGARVLLHADGDARGIDIIVRSEEHTSELQSLMRISYAVFCLKKKKNTPIPTAHSRNTYITH